MNRKTPSLVRSPNSTMKRGREDTPKTGLCAYWQFRNRKNWTRHVYGLFPIPLPKLERGIDWQLPGVWNYLCKTVKTKLFPFLKMVMKRVPTGEKTSPECDCSSTGNKEGRLLIFDWCPSLSVVPVCSSRNLKGQKIFLMTKPFKVQLRYL